MPREELTPEQAVQAMLNGETLYTADDDWTKHEWSEDRFVFYDPRRLIGAPPTMCYFTGLCRIKKQ